MLDQLKLSQVMSAEPITIDAYENIQRASRLMLLNKISHLPIVADGKIVGLVSNRDIMASNNYRYRSELNVSDIMQEDPFVFEPDTPIPTVVKDMFDFKLDAVLVADDPKKLQGIFTRQDVLRLVLQPTRQTHAKPLLRVASANQQFEPHQHNKGDPMIDTVKAKDIMTKTPVELSPEDPAHEIKNIMDDHKICHLPVTASGKLFGMVCRHAATAASYYGGPGFLKAADFLQPCDLIVTPETTLADLSFVMFKKRYDCLPVVNGNDELIGLVHLRDLLQAFLFDAAQKSEQPNNVVNLRPLNVA